MLNLLIVSLIWAFSFGLIKGNLSGIDSNFVSFARMLISLVCFAPFVRIRGVGPRLGLRLALTGVVQYGIMYITYIYSFRFLQAYEVALFTILTPLYVTAINDALRGRFSKLNLLTALLAVVGAWIVRGGGGIQDGVLQGFLMMQVSNLCFAFGQVYYRRLLADRPAGLRDVHLFGYLYLGAVAATALATTLFGGWGAAGALTTNQALTLLYLGAVASGLGFFLWNVGARQASAGALAVFNNLKIPLAIAVSLLLFGEQANIPNLLWGGLVVTGALALNEVLRHRDERGAASSEKI
jgi:drug/metabolite transporter (DMT)-like permease